MLKVLHHIHISNWPSQSTGLNPIGTPFIKVDWTWDICILKNKLNVEYPCVCSVESILTQSIS